MHPATEYERAPPQWLTHPRGQTIDPPDVRAHRSQIAAGSQRCRQDDEVMLVTQFRFQSLEVGNERSDAGGERLGQTQLFLTLLRDSRTALSTALPALVVRARTVSRSSRRTICTSSSSRCFRWCSSNDIRLALGSDAHALPPVRPFFDSA